ncbi:hypothetical protein BD626DRAFT_402977 [Schizophyllum amplum]|uniref:RRM domain-containing protein n=1 Tax=Schizophyllum amplum TaxID=97359 RepID=A0A550CEH4_9AGAR|nr:hypothetical protein BD626DRAFT_402977 [Auriculariopsis ampla]
MSRLIIKNLPSYVTPDRLRQHFEQKGAPHGTLTDVKVAMKQDGTSRRFGFVGYKSEQEAQAARNYFHKTFIDATRIMVDDVEGIQERPRKRRKLDGDGGVPEKPTKEAKQPRDAKDVKKSSQLDQYLEVMQPRAAKGPAWADGQQSLQPPVPPAQDEPAEDAMDTTEDAKDEGASDLDWLRKHTSKNVDTADRVFEQSDNEEDSNEPEAIAAAQPSEDPTIEMIKQTARLFVRNLAFSCSDAELTELFSPLGTLSQVHIPVDATTKQSKGVAYVTFANPEDAVTAYQVMDKKSFQGRILHILPAVDRRPKPEDASDKKKTVKDEKQAQRKALAGKEFNWSMLFMNSDAVASSIADRMNIDKSSILNPEESDNAAVRLALAETHIIQETKSYLESQGVNLTSFASQQRSDTAILVKNIPYGTSDAQIRELFESSGSLARVIVPPAGTMAIVEFENAADAQKGFRAVAYRRLGNSVIYLEKGPAGMFDGAPAPPVTIPDTEEAEDEPALSAGTTLFVKNLSFATSSERLVQIFGGLPGFSFARVQMKPDPKKPNGRLSMGYGFVGFKAAEDAKRALKSMSGFVLDGHTLQVKFAGRGAEEDDGARKGAKNAQSTTTKMIVKNVPFEATKKDIRELFGAHGQLKSVRLPRKFDARARGFAFLDFVTRQEAENAMAALRHTHLLGRHLVLEWAEEGEQDIDALRKKAGVGFGDGKDLPNRKRKLDMGKVGDVDVDVEGLE